MERFLTNQPYRFGDLLLATTGLKFAAWTAMEIRNAPPPLSFVYTIPWKEDPRLMELIMGAMVIMVVLAGLQSTDTFDSNVVMLKWNGWSVQEPKSWRKPIANCCKIRK